jgi:sugar O-acyltransferase (sialic acid O-acetyltransferase NeuD family)
MEKIILIGGGGHCKSVIDVIRAQGQFDIEGILDSNLPVGSLVLDVKVLGDDSLIESLIPEYRNFHITIGQIRSNTARKNIATLLSSRGAKFPKIVSPKAYISVYAQLGIGVTIMHNATINAEAKVGNFTIVNNHALIEHDVQVGDFCHISTGAIVNGNSIINDNVFIGSGAVIIQGSKIGTGNFIKANQIFK